MSSLLPNRNKFINNFSHCKNWEEKYLYLIELGSYLSPLPQNMRISKYLIQGCQNRVWIVIDINKKDNTIHFYGDSDALIVKGLIAIVFIFYKNSTLSKIISMDIYEFLNKISIYHNITTSRSHGLDSIIRTMQLQASTLLKSENYNK